MMREIHASQPQQAPSAWKRLVDDQVARIDLAFSHAARLEGQRIEGARLALGEMARLTQDTFAFWSQLNASYCKLSLDAARRVGELMIPRE